MKHKINRVWLYVVATLMVVVLMSWNCYNCLRDPLTENFVDKPYVLHQYSEERCIHGKNFGPFGSGKMYAQGNCEGNFNLNGYKTWCKSENNKFTVCPQNTTNSSIVKVDLGELKGYSLEENKDFPGTEIDSARHLKDCAEQCDSNANCYGIGVLKDNTDPDNPVAACTLKGAGAFSVEPHRSETVSTYKKKYFGLPQQSGYTLEEGKHYVNGDIQQYTNLQQCQAGCSADPNCQGFVVERDNRYVQNPIRTCSTKNATAFDGKTAQLGDKYATYKKNQLPALQSYTLLTDKDYTGGDLGTATTLDECKRRCDENTTSCGGFVVDARSGKLPITTCWLKNSTSLVGEPTSNTARSTYRKVAMPTAAPTWADPARTTPVMYGTFHTALSQTQQSAYVTIINQQMTITNTLPRVTNADTASLSGFGEYANISMYFFAHKPGAISTLKISGVGDVAIALIKYNSANENASSVNTWMDKDYMQTGQTIVRSANPLKDTEWTVPEFKIEAGNAYELRVIGRNAKLPNPSVGGRGSFGTMTARVSIIAGLSDLKQYVYFAKDTTSDSTPISLKFLDMSWIRTYI